MKCTQPPTGVEITLTPTEQRIAQFIAKQRYKGNRDDGIVDGKIGPQSNEFTDLEGFASELAFCRLFNIYPDFSISTRSGGSDCIFLGSKVDVKSTRYRSGHLIARKSKKLVDTDIYALMIGEFPTYHFVGTATSEELLSPERIEDMGYGDTFAMSQSDLVMTPPTQKVFQCHS